MNSVFTSPPSWFKWRSKFLSRLYMFTLHNCIIRHRLILASDLCISASLNKYSGNHRKFLVGFLLLLRFYIYWTISCKSINRSLGKNPRRKPFTGWTLRQFLNIVKSQFSTDCLWRKSTIESDLIRSLIWSLKQTSQSVHGAGSRPLFANSAFDWQWSWPNHCSNGIDRWRS